MTIIAALAITVIGVDILAVGYRTVKVEFLPIGPAASVRGLPAWAPNQSTKGERTEESICGYFGLSQWSSTNE